MDTLTHFVDLFLHIDKHLAVVMQSYGAWTYAILFLIVFCETGLVVTPFLPGDSLLFAAGALAAAGSLNVHLLAVLLIAAAVLGDAANYHVGRFIGPKVFQKKDSRIFKQQYIEKTQHFYDKYGTKTIVLARFVPIVRTFAPFLAGVGAMGYMKFAAYNIVGAVLWVALFLYCGYMFSEIELVKKNFSLVILAIIVVSLLPGVIEIIRARNTKSSAA